MKNILRQKQLRWKLGLLLGCAALSSVLPAPAHAEVLEQKWQAGQQLSYDFKLDGTLRFTTPADTIIRGFPIGGLPLEMLIKSDGLTTFDTREVDDFGTALVVPRLERMQVKFNETTFNQNGTLGLRDGKATFAVNGQNIGEAGMDIGRLVNPNFGLRFTKSLRVTGFESLKAPAASAAPATETPAAPKSPLPVSFPAMIQAMITRAIPPLLPVRDVNIGDTWNANIEWPVMPGAQPAAEPKAPLGKFNFKALAEEDVQGRKAWRIATEGIIEAADVSTKGASEAIEKQSTTAGQAMPFKIPNLFSLKQQIKGDIWFDPAAGQVVKTDLRLDSSGETRLVPGKAADGSMSFNGNLQMDLRKTSFAGGQ